MTENTLGQAIARLQSLREMAAETRQAAGMLEMEIIQQMEANGQALYEDGKLSARIPVKREYDVAKFASVMGELMEPAQFDEVYSPEHEVTKTVPASVNGTKAKRLWEQGFSKDLEKTLLPNKRSLKIELRKTESPL